MHGLSPLLYNCTTTTVVNVLFLPDTNQIFENVSQTFLWQNVSLYSPFHSIRSASIPGWSTSGGGLPSPQAAGWGSETGHQTPQERKQQTQGTSLVLLLLWYCINSGWWRLVILTQTTFEFQAEKMRASWQPCLHSALPNCHRSLKKAPCHLADSTQASTAGLTNCWQLCSSLAARLRLWTSPGRQQVRFRF